MARENKAQKATTGLLSTLEGQRALGAAIFTSDQAVIDLLGAHRFESDPAQCHSCGQQTVNGTVYFRIIFDDGSIIHSYLR